MAQSLSFVISFAFADFVAYGEKHRLEPNVVYAKKVSREGLKKRIRLTQTMKFYLSFLLFAHVGLGISLSLRREFPKRLEYPNDFGDARVSWRPWEVLHTTGYLGRTWPFRPTGRTLELRRIQIAIAHCKLFLVLAIPKGHEQESCLSASSFEYHNVIVHAWVHKHWIG